MVKVYWIPAGKGVGLRQLSVEKKVNSSQQAAGRGRLLGQPNWRRSLALNLLTVSEIRSFSDFWFSGWAGLTAGRSAQGAGQEEDCGNQGGQAQPVGRGCAPGQIAERHLEEQADQSGG